MWHVTSDNLPRGGWQRASRAATLSVKDAARVARDTPPGDTPRACSQRYMYITILIQDRSRRFSTTISDQQPRWQPRSWESVNDTQLEQKVGSSPLPSLSFSPFLFFSLTDSFLCRTSVALAQQASCASTSNSRGSGQPVYIVDTPTQISH